MSEAERTSLININKSLETAFRNVVDVEKFEKIAGFTVAKCSQWMTGKKFI
jgi:hypothetical protein